jgi:hypothetical protein
MRECDEALAENKLLGRQLQVVLDAIALADILKQDIDRSKLKLAIYRERYPKPEED